MSYSKNRALVGMVGVVLALAGSSALAGWNFNDSAVQWAGSGTGTTATASDAGVSVTASAFYSGSSFSAGTQFAKGTLNKWDTGLGAYAVTDSRTNEHAMDNRTYTDMVLFHFSKDVILDMVTLGWVSNDGDFTVLRYDGAAASPLDKDTGKLNYSGWTTVKNVFTSTKGDKTFDGTVNGGEDGSSWWLVSAFNTSFGGDTTGKDKTATSDYFKLASLKGTVVPTDTGGGNPVPEPGSLALIGAAALGALGLRRRRANTGS